MRDHPSDVITDEIGEEDAEQVVDEVVELVLDEMVLGQSEAMVTDVTTVLFDELPGGEHVHALTRPVGRGMSRLLRSHSDKVARRIADVLRIQMTDEEAKAVVDEAVRIAFDAAADEPVEIESEDGEPRVIVGA